MFVNNPALLWVALVTLAFVPFYLGIVMQVGRMRARHNIPAPRMEGHPELERALRIQGNTLEQMVPFFAVLWLAAITWDARWAALAGLVFLLARIAYAIGYFREPSRRMAGFMIGQLAIAVLWLGAIYGVVRALLLS
jgi:glutathione S-transferase